MAKTSESTRRAAKRNVRRATAAARRKRTISKLPKRVRTALGQEGAKAAKRRRRRGRRRAASE